MINIGAYIDTAAAVIFPSCAFLFPSYSRWVAIGIRTEVLVATAVRDLQ